MTGSISSYFTGVSGGLVMSLIAFSIVFIVIVGLMMIMMMLKHLCAVIDGTAKQAPVAAPQPAPVATSVAVSTAPAVAPVSSADDEGELLAVITAAIAAMCGSTARVVSFAQTNNQAGIQAPVASAWKFTSRTRSMEGFQD